MLCQSGDAMKHVLAVVALVVTASSVQAADKTKMCAKVADVMHAAAEARDKGVPESLLRDSVPGMLKHTPSLISDVQDMVHVVYESPSLSPGEFWPIAFNSCMRD